MPAPRIVVTNAIAANSCIADIRSVEEAASTFGDAEFTILLELQWDGQDGTPGIPGHSDRRLPGYCGRREGIAGSEVVSV
jgi:hypothetical protein